MNNQFLILQVFDYFIFKKGLLFFMRGKKTQNDFTFSRDNTMGGGDNTSNITKTLTRLVKI